jgi:ArsR family transcriptional regulator, cadmium/lead-responsive transcriptional repressor
MLPRAALAAPDAQATELQAKLFRGFADASRLGILRQLTQGRRKVSDLVAATGLSQPNVSNHLSCLKECGLVRAEPEGRFVYYELADDRVAKLLALAQEVLADVAENIYDCTRYAKGKRDA